MPLKECTPSATAPRTRPAAVVTIVSRGWPPHPVVAAPSSVAVTAVVRRNALRFITPHSYDVGFAVDGITYGVGSARVDRKSTRLNSSHVKTSYAVFCLKKIKD